MEEIFIPASGMAAEDVLLSEWLKEPGDEVAEGEPVAVVETDKATVELSGTSAGRLSRHLVEAGARVPGGTTVAYLLSKGENEPGTAAPIQSSVAEPEVESPRAPLAPARERTGDGRHTLSPRQRRAMAEAAAANAASAPAASAPAASAPAASAPATASSTNGDGATGPAVAKRSSDRSSNRRATAALVSESWRTVPHFSVGRDVRLDGLLEAVSTLKAAGVAVTVTDFLALSLSSALQALGEEPDVGLAVATDWGVLIPVLRSLSGRSLPEVAALRQAAVGRARSRRLDSADTAPPFATLSNLGPSGVTWFTGVIPVNQVALVTVGEVSLRPAVEGRGLVVAPMMSAVVTADHRHYDGVDSARLLGEFVDNLAQLTDAQLNGAQLNPERSR